MNERYGEEKNPALSHKGGVIAGNDLLAPELLIQLLYAFTGLLLGPGAESDREAGCRQPESDSASFGTGAADQSDRGVFSHSKGYYLRRRKGYQ